MSAIPALPLASQQEAPNSAEQNSLNLHTLLFASTVLTFSFGYANGTKSVGDSGSSGSVSGAKFIRKGGGGGPGKSQYPSTLSARASAEEDVKKLEEEAAERPYTVGTITLGSHLKRMILRI